MKSILGIAILALILSVGSLVWQAWPEGSESLRKEQPAKQYRPTYDPVEAYEERKRNRFNDDWRLRELEDKIECVQQRAGNDGIYPRC